MLRTNDQSFNFSVNSWMKHMIESITQLKEIGFFELPNKWTDDEKASLIRIFHDIKEHFEQYSDLYLTV